MAKLPSKRKPILRIVLISSGAAVGAFILLIVASFVLSPVFDGIDKTKFEVMKTEAKEINKALQQASGGTEVWKFETSCVSGGQGGFQTYPEYSCSTISSIDVPAISSQQLVNLHDKYYSVIDNSARLHATSALDKQYPGQFGILFVVSSAEKQYTIANGGQSCDYLAKLTQPYDTNGTYDHTYGADVAPGGRVIISLTCDGIARGNWYE